MSSRASTDVVSAPGAATALATLAAPGERIADLSPEHLEQYVLAGMHQDRRPGNVLIVLHPAKRIKLPEGLAEALEEGGFAVTVVETRRDLFESARSIRDALLQLAGEPRPLDVIVVGGDGTLDHHVLVGAFAACYPDLIRERSGELVVRPVEDEVWGSAPEGWREIFSLDDLPEEDLPPPDQEAVEEIWRIRQRLEGLLLRRAPAAKVLKRTGRTAHDLFLRIALYSSLFPDRVDLRPPFFDLTGLAEAPQARTFRGLYPLIRALVAYPAGTAADNAIFSGVPGLLLGLTARRLHSTRLLTPLRRRLSRTTLRAFLHYFCEGSTVVPARLSLIALDGVWQRLGSHAIGGPASGRFFEGDLHKKTKGISGYLARIPAVVVGEGMLGTTRVTVTCRDWRGRLMTRVEGGIAESLYTNRTFIAGVGSVPMTTPTSFAGESSLALIPPVIGRRADRRRMFSLRGLLGFIEAIVKGVAARGLHWMGFDPGRWAGEGELIALPPSHVMAMKEGDEVSMDYADQAGAPRIVPVHVSGDPYQAYRLRIKVFWGPIPMLAAHDSLLLNSTRRTLNHLRMQASFHLHRVYIGGVLHFRYVTAEFSRSEIEERTGLLYPPRHLPPKLPAAMERIMASWKRLGTGDFVDTSPPGRRLRHRVLRAHTSDHRAHLILMRRPGGELLVRQLRSWSPDRVFEARMVYRRTFLKYRTVSSQVIDWSSRPPRIVYEEHVFRDSQEFQAAAPTFFPMLTDVDGRPTLPETWSDSWSDREELSSVPDDPPAREL